MPLRNVRVFKNRNKTVLVCQESMTYDSETVTNRNEP
jgi:hypothetical protein